MLLPQHSWGSIFRFLPRNKSPDIQVLSQEIVTPVSEHALVEIIGTLTDNAFEAATPQKNQVEMVLDARNDKLIFIAPAAAAPHSSAPSQKSQI